MLFHNYIDFHERYHREDRHQRMESDVQVPLIYVQLHSQVDFSK